MSWVLTVCRSTTGPPAALANTGVEGNEIVPLGLKVGGWLTVAFLLVWKSTAARPSGRTSLARRRYGVGPSLPHRAVLLGPVLV